jgi:hypothetical protein
MENILTYHTRITQWRTMEEVRDERRVSYNYQYNSEDINELSSNYSDLSDNLKNRTAKIYDVLRKGVIPKFDHPSESILLSFDRFTYELSPKYMFWMLPLLDDERKINGRLSPHVRPYEMKVNDKDSEESVHEDELKHIHKHIFKKFQQFGIYITF